LLIFGNELPDSGATQNFCCNLTAARTSRHKAR